MYFWKMRSSSLRCLKLDCFQICVKEHGTCFSEWWHVLGTWQLGRLQWGQLCCWVNCQGAMEEAETAVHVAASAKDVPFPPPLHA